MTSHRFASDESVQKRVSDIVRETLAYKKVAVELDSELLASESGLFDSFSLLELVLRIEGAFQVQIPDEDLDPEIFRSVRTVSDYLTVKLRGE